MKHIQLSQSRTALIDAQDFDAVTALGKWHFNSSGYAVLYTRDSEGKRRTRYLHRLVMEFVLSHPPGRMQVDHINVNRLDCRRENLRLATPSENQAAKGNQKNSRSGQKGVRLRAGKWDVRVRFYHNRLCLGRYDDFDLAVAVYGYAHRLLWKDFTSECPLDAPLPDEVLDKVNDRIAKMLPRL